MAIGWIAVTIVFAGINERTMGRLAEQVVGSAKQEMVEGIKVTVASKVAGVLNIGVEHQTEIVDLLRL